MDALKSKRILVSTLVVALICLSHFLHLKTVEKLASVQSIQVAKPLPSPRTVKLICLGFDQVAADLFWLTFVQYVGDGESRQRDNFSRAYEYLDLVTSLDPKFIQPYWFAAFVVGSEMQRPDLAQPLIERGIQANQNNWYLPFIAGINQYLFAHKEAEAARYYKMAAKFPDAPIWLDRQAEILQAKIPSLVKEVNTWDTIYRNSTDQLVKDRAKERLAASWMRVFKVSPSEEIRKKAQKALAALGVEGR